MNNKSPFLLSELRKCRRVTWALLLEVSTCSLGELCSCSDFFFSHQHPHPNKHTHLSKWHTHIQADCGVTHPHNLSSPSPPRQTQACDVAVSDNEVRILWLQSVRMTAAQALMQPAWLVSGALCWLSAAPAGPGDGSLPKSSSNALQSGRSRVDLRMTSREWQWLSRPTPTATCQSRKHKGTLAALPILLCMGRTHSGREGGRAYI